MLRSYLVLLFVVIMAAGCTNSGAFLAANQTNVDLREANYTLTTTDIYGEAEAEYILGVSYSTGLAANTIAIARINGSDKLYSDALKSLWQNYESNHGQIGDKKLALVNVRYDSDIINLLLYTKVKVTVRADVVEFI